MLQYSIINAGSRNIALPESIIRADYMVVIDVQSYKNLFLIKQNHSQNVKKS